MAKDTKSPGRTRPAPPRLALCPLLARLRPRPSRPRDKERLAPGTEVRGRLESRPVRPPPRRLPLGTERRKAGVPLPRSWPEAPEPDG